MTFSIGLDIGGTKIAGAVFDTSNKLLAEKTVPTPTAYDDFLLACGALIELFDKACGKKASLGLGIAGAINQEHGTVFAPNLPFLENRSLRADAEKKFGRTVHIANDADCAALSEALDGAGKDYRTVFGLIMGTGVGGGLVVDKKIYQGIHGLAGEIGHLPLPFREDPDGPLVDCGCGQKGCIDKSLSGPALTRLYKMMVGKDASAEQIADLVKQGDVDARRVLDRFYTVAAKAMITIIHAFDPEIVIVNGGLIDLPGFYVEVPKRCGRYALNKNLRTKLVPAKFGTLSGIMGAARLAQLF